MGKGKGPKRQGWQMPWTCWQRARQSLVALRLVRRCVPEPTALPAAAAAQATHGCIRGQLYVSLQLRIMLLLALWPIVHPTVGKSCARPALLSLIGIPPYTTRAYALVESRGGARGGGRGPGAPGDPVGRRRAL